MTNPPQGDDREQPPGRREGATAPYVRPPVPGTGRPPEPPPPPQQPPPGPPGPPAAGPAYGQQPPPYLQLPVQGGPGYGQQPGFGPPPQYGPFGQPPIGPPPQYGTPYAPPPQQKSKVGLIAGVTAGVLVVIAGVVVLVMALQSRVLDPSAVEREVAAQFEQREGVAVELSCPDGMDVDKGASYDCTGTTADGEEVTLRITIADENSAAYTWAEP